MNRNGGVGNVPVDVVFGNTFSDADRSAESARELVEMGVVVVIGPGGDEVAAPVRSALAADGIPLLSPLASTTVAEDAGLESPWFRMSPTTTVMGRNLAKLAGDDGNRNMVAVMANDAYHAQLGQAFAQRFASYGELDEVVTLEHPEQSLQPLAANLAARVDAGLDAVMLALHPRVAARLATEVAALRNGKPPPRWYLAPRLKTDLLLQNASPGALEGAKGVGPEVFATTRGEFESRFAQGVGDVPFDATFFMYDATAVALVAMDRARAAGAELPAGLAPAVEQVASFGGIVVRWNEFDVARRINRDGGALQYTGLTGPVILAADGSRAIGTSSIWGVENGAITDH
jgi:branched-chain amino acid transport system substrate-binding protein